MFVVVVIRLPDLDEARRWVEEFRRWYNKEHRHSAASVM
jgi:transposase InsO family protein